MPTMRELQLQELSERALTPLTVISVGSEAVTRERAKDLWLASHAHFDECFLTRLVMPDASAKNVQLVGSVLERTPGSTASSSRPPAPKTGFPPVQHRTKSAFARSRSLSEKLVPGGGRPSRPPPIATGPSLSNDPQPSTSDESKWREDVSREHEKVVASMSPEERELERQAILERFGPGVGAILQRAKRNREMRRNGQEGMESGREIEQVPGSPGECLSWSTDIRRFTWPLQLCDPLVQPAQS
jgi:hypothetical protein